MRFATNRTNAGSMSEAVRPALKLVQMCRQPSIGGPRRIVTLILFSC
jgi:hypothetical protein